MNRKHGGTRTRLYQIYKDMKKRCYNPENKDYYNYGGRGIEICDEWVIDFSSFREWAYNNGYDDALTIDRIDNNKGYEPNNCRWATLREQFSNRRTNNILTFRNETDTLTNLANKYGLKPETIRSRLKVGKSLKEVFAPARKYVKKSINTNYTKKPIVLTSKNTGEKYYFESIELATRYLGLAHGQISTILSGRHKTIHGYYAEYQIAT